MGNICIPFQHQLLQLFSPMIIWELLHEPQVKGFQWEKWKETGSTPRNPKNNNFRWPSSKFSDVESEYPKNLLTKTSCLKNHWTPPVEGFESWSQTAAPHHILHNPLDKATHLEDDKFEEGSRVQLLVRIGSLQLKCLRQKRILAGSSRMISQSGIWIGGKLLGIKKPYLFNSKLASINKKTLHLRQLHGTLHGVRIIPIVSPNSTQFDSS